MIKKELMKRYRAYVAALKANNEQEAIRRATYYNDYLRISGGPEKVSGELYLSMGE